MLSSAGPACSSLCSLSAVCLAAKKRSLSRSGKKILHIDPNNYYGGPNAALSLQDVEDWAHRHSFTKADPNSESSKLFSSIVITKPDDAETSGLSFPRAYSLALAPQLIHTRSALLAQLVASHAYKQVEFQAVGSFFVFQAAKASSTGSPQLARVPSTREDVFSTTAIPARSKRQLMKFLKFVFYFQDEEQKVTWEDHKDDQLETFLKDKFGLDEQLRTYILALTLARDSTTLKVEQGLETIHQHLASTGMFGPGFAAVYPKWGGAGEIAQVACRACAVGGGVYVLGTGAKSFKPAVPTGEGEAEAEVEVELSNCIVVKTKLFIRDSGEDAAEGSETVSIMIAIIASPMASLFEITVEGAPTPAVAVVVFPQGSQGPDGSALKYPVFAAVHSSDTGECPAGQSVIYLSTTAYPGSQSILLWALDSLLSATVGPPVEGNAAEANAPKCLYKVSYEQVAGTASSEPRVDGKVVTFPPSSASLVFDDAMLAGVRRAWDLVMGPAVLENGIEYMVFPDREEMGDDEDAYL